MNVVITFTPEELSAIAERAGELVQKQFPTIDYLAAVIPTAVEQAVADVTGFTKFGNGEWRKVP